MNEEEIRPDVPRHDLIRGLSPMRAEDDGNVMVGYPIVFNQWTEINSWEGHFLERVLPSGPMKSMKDGRQRVQYNHGMHPTIGSSGLGKPRLMKRDEFGIYTETPLSDTSYNRDIIRPLLMDGTLDGMSFRFSVIEDKWRQPKEPADHNPAMLPERSLVEFKWLEFGPVDWPAYEAASAGIRSQAAFAMWLQTPHEQRTELMRKFDITVPTERRMFVVPGWDAPSAVDVDGTDTSEPAPEATRSDDSGPDSEATRTETTDDPSAAYLPTVCPPMSADRRKSQVGTVKAWLATRSAS